MSVDPPIATAYMTPTCSPVVAVLGNDLKEAFERPSGSDRLTAEFESDRRRGATRHSQVRRGLALR